MQSSSSKIGKKCGRSREFLDLANDGSKCEKFDKCFVPSNVESITDRNSDMSFSPNASLDVDGTLQDIGGSGSNSDIPHVCSGKDNKAAYDICIENYPTSDTSVQPPPKRSNLSKYNAKDSREKFKIDYMLFRKDERVPYVPHNIDGLHKYIILCNEIDWKSKQKDGQYWKTTCGKNQNLNGFCRVSKCHGSLQCMNDKCPKVQCNLGMNKSSFERFAGEYTCKICGHLVQRKWCGAKKAIEYDRVLKKLTVWHQGYHNCKLKQADDRREHKEKKKNVLKFILASNPKATKAKLIDQGTQYYLSRGDHEGARKFVKAATDSSAIKEARKETLSDIIGYGHAFHTCCFPCEK